MGLWGRNDDKYKREMEEWHAEREAKKKAAEDAEYERWYEKHSPGAHDNDAGDFQGHAEKWTTRDWLGVLLVVALLGIPLWILLITGLIVGR